MAILYLEQAEVVYRDFKGMRQTVKREEAEVAECFLYSKNVSKPRRNGLNPD